jgi:hypothetical protein
MKTSNIALLSVAALLGLAATTGAYANGRGHHGHGGARFGVFIGAPLFPYYRPYPYYSPYYYPPSYYPPTVVAPSAPPVYIEQGAVAAPAGPTGQASGAFWYYCPTSRTYYPYVQQCSTPWQPVTPQATPPS